MVTLSQLHIYPIKSCAGISLREATLGPLGLEMDRRWMLVDHAGNFLSQRSHPAMATIVPLLEPAALTVQAPGMPLLRLPLEIGPAPALPVTIWKDQVSALDCGAAAHQWFSSFLGSTVRLVQFDPAWQRVCSQRWTGDLVATTQFSDGYPLLVANEESLLDLNQRMQSKGAPALPMNRFRPNLVVSGLAAYEEDYVATLSLGEPQQAIVLRLVKPCARCPIPGIDQQTGLRDAGWPHEPLDTLAQYRADPRVDGGLTFGQNAVLAMGAGQQIRVGQALQVELNF